MRDTLAINSEITLQKATGEHRSFILDGIAGTGANFIVYDAHYLNEFKMKKHIRLKECFPLRYAQPNREGNNILWDSAEAKKQAFSELEFVYKRQMHLQEQIEFTNFSSHIIDDIYYGNNTGYLIINKDVAQTFQNLEIESLQSLLKIVLHLSRTIGAYHEANLLHLDIKPENFCVLDKTEQQIKLIDFDSFVSMDEVEQGIMQSLSYTNSWSAPEVKQGRFHQIGTVSDVYSIGSILFYGLFRRPMEAGDILMLESLNLADHALMEKLNPAILEPLEHFLRKCLEPSVRLRYQNTAELCKELEKLIPMADPKALFLCSSIPEQLSYFTGRQKELTEVHNLLQNHKMVLINGYGGVGKSEFSKYYAHQYRNSYSQVVWFHLENNITDAFCNGRNIPIANYDDLSVSFENAEDKSICFSRKLNTLKGLVTENTLFVIDDVRDFTNKDLLELLKLDCKFLFTSRKNPRELFAKEKIYTLNNMDYPSLESIFLHHYSLSSSKEELALLPELFKKIDNYTLLIPIMAKQMQLRGWYPSEMINKLTEDGISKAGKDSIPGLKDDEFVDDTMYHHVKRLFNLAELTDSQKKAIAILSWLESLNISRKQLQKWCGLEDDYNETQALIRNGWIYHDERIDVLSIHNVIGDIINEEVKLSIDSVPVFKEYLLSTYQFSKSILVEKVIQHFDISKEEHFYFAMDVAKTYHTPELLFRFLHEEIDTERKLWILEFEFVKFFTDILTPFRGNCNNQWLVEKLQMAYRLSKENTTWKLYKGYEHYWTKALKLHYYNSYVKEALGILEQENEYQESCELIRQIVQELEKGTQDSIMKQRITYFLGDSSWWMEYFSFDDTIPDPYYPDSERCPKLEKLEKIFEDVKQGTYPFLVPPVNSYPLHKVDNGFQRQPQNHTTHSNYAGSTEEKLDMLKEFYIPGMEKSMEQHTDIHLYIIDLLKMDKLSKQDIIDFFIEKAGNHYEANDYLYYYYILIYAELSDKGVFGTLSLIDYAYLKLEKAKSLLYLKCYRRFFKEFYDLQCAIEKLIHQNDESIQGELERILIHTIIDLPPYDWDGIGAYIYVTLYGKLSEENIVNRDSYVVALDCLKTYAQNLGCRELLYTSLEKLMKYDNVTFFDNDLQIADKISINSFVSLEQYISKIARAENELQLQDIATYLLNEKDVDEQSLYFLKEACLKKDDSSFFAITDQSYDAFVEQDSTYTHYFDDIEGAILAYYAPF